MQPELKYIEEKILNVEKRIQDGEEIIQQCKLQLRKLKARCKEFKRLKQLITVSLAD